MLKEVMPMIKKILINPIFYFSFSTWMIGKIFTLKGYPGTGILFEVVSKVSGRRQYIDNIYQASEV
jgi:hypothetical protein